MSARDVIASRVYAFGEDRRYASADAILKALHAAGYRILAPGQIDDWTKERCAEVADQSAVVQHLSCASTSPRRRRRKSAWKSFSPTWAIPIRC